MKGLSLDAFTLKLIAIISMVAHHAFMVLWQIFPIEFLVAMNFLMGVTFPIMAFFVVEGFNRTRNIKRYMLRLLIFGAIAQIPYMLAFGVPTLNIVFSILVGLICLQMHKKFYVEKSNKALFVVLFILILIVSTFTVEGGFFGVLMIFLFNVIKGEMRRRTIPLIVYGGLMVLMSLLGNLAGDIAQLYTGELHGMLAYAQAIGRYFSIPIGTFLIIPLLRAYNGNLGRKAKFLFYTVYPLHFVILVIIAMALGLTGLNLPF